MPALGRVEKSSLRARLPSLSCAALRLDESAASMMDALELQCEEALLPFSREIGAQSVRKMIRVPLLTLTLTACAALRPFRAPQTQKDTVLGRRDLGAAACAAVAFVAQSARAEPRDQWIAAQKEIDSILAASARVLVPTHRTRSTRRSSRAGLAHRGRRRRHPAAHRHRRHDESVV